MSAADNLFLYVPESGHPAYFDNGEKREMSQQVNNAVVDEWGDDNPIHTYEGFATVFAEETGLFKVQIPAESTVTQGVIAPYEDVRTADTPVGYVSTAYDKPVDTTSTVDRDVQDRATIIRKRPDLAELANDEDSLLEDTVTSRTELGYTDESRDNPQNAYKIPGVLGIEPHHGEVLLEVEATLGNGTGWLEVTGRQSDEITELDGTGTITDDTYVLQDGTEVRYRLLKVDPPVYQDVVDRFNERYEPTVTVPDHMQDSAATADD